jgi:hypothetical protein
MVDAIKQKKALKAVQDLICHGRKLGYEGADSQTLAKFLDDLEYLPGLMLEGSDRTEVFEKHLKGMCGDYDCSYIVTWYEKK